MDEEGTQGPSQVGNVRTIREWAERGGKPFDEEVMQVVKRAAERACAGPSQDPTELYRGWTEIVEHRDSVERGMVLALWDEVDKVLTAAPKGTGASWTTSVLHETLISVWDLAPYEKPLPGGELVWVQAVEEALARAARDRSDGRTSYASLNALLDLIVAVHADNENPASSVGAWVEIACREAKAVRAQARGCKAVVGAFPDSARGFGMAGAVEVTLALFVSAARYRGKHDGRAGSVEAISALMRSTWVLDNDVTGRDIARMLRHHAYDSKLAALLVATSTASVEFPVCRQPDKIDSIASLEQSILLLGARGVGKTSFLFASEALCGSTEHDEATPGRYPRIALEILNDQSYADPIRELELRRGRWKEGEESRDTVVSLAARAGPRGLCSYRIVDTMGEMVVRSRGSNGPEDILASAIGRLRDPGIVALILSARGHDDDRVRSGIEASARNVVEILARRGTGTIPVLYLIVNKLDEWLDALRPGPGEEIDKDARDAVVAETNDKVFDLEPYLREASGRDGAANGQRSLAQRLERIRSDPDLTDSLALRELIIETVSRWDALLRAVSHAGVRDVHLAFVSCLPEQRGARSGGGGNVNAFWSHLWERYTQRLEDPLEAHALTTFRDDARRNARAALELDAGLRIEPSLGAGELEAPTDAEGPQVDWTKFGKRIRRRSGRRAGVDKLLASLSDEHAEVAEWSESVVAKTRKLRARWVTVFLRTFAELDCAPHWPCDTMRPDMLGDSLRRWIEDRKAGLRKETATSEDHDGGRMAEPGKQDRTFDELSKVIKDSKLGADAQNLLLEAIRESLAAAEPDKPNKALDDLSETVKGSELDGYTKGQLLNEIHDFFDKSTDEWWAKRRQFKDSELDGYYGALRGSSLLSDAWPKRASKLHEWLAQGSGLSIVERFEEEIERHGSVEHGLRPETRGVLWQIAGHGSSEGEEFRSGPDYAMLTPKRWCETDRLLLRSLVEVQRAPVRRLGVAIELIESLAKIRASGVDAASTLETRVWSGVRGWLIARTFKGLGLVAQAWNEGRDDFAVQVRNARAAIAKARYSIKDWVQPPGRRDVLGQCEDLLRRYWKAGEMPRLAPNGMLGYAEAERQLAVIEMCLDALGEGANADADKPVGQRVRTACATTADLCSHHNELVSKYAQEVAICVLEIYAGWLKNSVALDEDEARDLQEKVFRHASATFDLDIEAQPCPDLRRITEKTVEDAVEVFERIVKKRSVAVGMA